MIKELTKYFYAKKALKFQDLIKKIGWFVSLDVEKKPSKLRNSSFYQIMPLSKNPKTPLKTKVLDKTKTWRPRFLECPERHVFRLAKRIVFEGVFGFFFTK